MDRARQATDKCLSLSPFFGRRRRENRCRSRSKLGGGRKAGSDGEHAKRPEANLFLGRLPECFQVAQRAIRKGKEKKKSAKCSSAGIALGDWQLGLAPRADVVTVVEWISRYRETVRVLPHVGSYIRDHAVSPKNVSVSCMHEFDDLTRRKRALVLLDWGNRGHV